MRSQFRRSLHPPSMCSAGAMAAARVPAAEAIGAAAGVHPTGQRATRRRATLLLHSLPLLAGAFNETEQSGQK